MGCATDHEIAAFVEGTLDDDEHGRVAQHVDGCAPCRRLAATAARSLDDGSGPAPKARGEVLGRYLTLEVIGSGAMGVVYAAYDPDLDRKIALKLLRPEGSSEDREALHVRLLREARALAKLSHPNVVAVHDVGTVGEDVFLAMELVRGDTLRAWLGQAPRSWREVVRRFVEAGEGLSAAHRAGVVHRDFKPDNVLVGADDRVRVVDFGLAREGRANVASGDAAPVVAADARITRTGALAGTPAYMAPEQLAGGHATAASDVYAFSMSLHEALWGTRPDGVASTIPKVRDRVPAALRSIVARGLSALPETRWSSMQAMLDALAGVERRSPRAAIVATGALLLTGAALLGARALRPSAEAPPPCMASEASLDGAWNEAARRETKAAFARVAGARGEAQADRVAAALDGYRAAFVGGHRDACIATRVRGDQSEAMLDLRVQCLDLRARAVSAVVRLFATADAELVDNALVAVQRLPDVAHCANRVALSSRASRAAALGPGDAEFEASFATLSALVAADRTTEAQAQLERTAEVAGAAKNAWFDARIAYVRGTLGVRQSRLDVARTALDKAAVGALATGDDELLADTWTALIQVAHRGTPPGDADFAAENARAAIVRLGGDDVRESARLTRLAAVREGRDGALEEANAMGLEAVRLAERSGRDAFALSRATEIVADIAIVRCDYDLAAAQIQRTIELRSRLFGDDHWSVDMAQGNLAAVAILQGRVDGRIEVLEGILARHPSWLYLNADIAQAHRARRDYGQALVRDTVASSRTATEHSDPWNLMLARIGQGEDLVMLGRPKEAVAPLVAALETKDVLPPHEIAHAELLLARALGATDELRSRDLFRAGCERMAPWAARYGDLYARRLSDAVAWRNGLPRGHRARDAECNGR